MRRCEGAVGAGGTALRLVVRNHPGVMSHVCGLFARRGFNLDAIACLPIADGARSVIILLVTPEERIEQLVRQLRKLEDVLEIEPAAGGLAVFDAMANLVT